MEAVVDDRDPQAPVTSYFEDDAAFWDEIYSRGDVFSRIYQRRLQTALGWVGQLRLGAGARVLDLGCGAGVISVALAKRGFQVTALDSARAMIDAASLAAHRAGVESRIVFDTADAHHLVQPDASFELVIALGLLPWLHDPQRGLNEMARVLAPGGTLIVSADNRRRLTNLIDPLRTPGLESTRHVVGRALGRSTGGVRARLDNPGSIRAMVKKAGLEPVTERSVGFGPFTFVGRRLLPDAAGVRLQDALERLAAAEQSRLRLLGTQYLVLARK